MYQSIFVIWRYFYSLVLFGAEILYVDFAHVFIHSLSCLFVVPVGFLQLNFEALPDKLAGWNFQGSFKPGDNAICNDKNGWTDFDKIWMKWQLKTWVFFFLLILKNDLNIGLILSPPNAWQNRRTDIQCWYFNKMSL